MVKGMLGYRGLWAAAVPDLRFVVILNSLIEQQEGAGGELEEGVAAEERCGEGTRA